MNRNRALRDSTRMPKLRQADLKAAQIRRMVVVGGLSLGMAEAGIRKRLECSVSGLLAAETFSEKIRTACLAIEILASRTATAGDSLRLQLCGAAIAP